MEAPGKDTDRYFEEIQEGEEWSLENPRTITEADVVNFAGISSDFHPLHMSKAFAEKTEYGERVAHGNLVFSIAEAIIGDMNPKAFSYGYDHLRFIEAVYIGDTLSIHREVIEVESYNAEYGRVVYKYDVENQHGDTVLACEHITLVEKRETE